MLPPTRDLCGMLLIACLAVWTGCTSDPAATRTRHQNRGDAYLSQNKFKEAIIEYRNAINADPKAAEPHEKLAEAYVRDRESREAFREFIAAADLMPSNVAYQVRAGEALLLTGKFAEARRRAEIALKLDPTDVHAQLLRGHALAELRDIDAALTQVEDAVRDGASPGLSLATLGVLLQFAKGNLSEAEEAFNRAVVADPRSVAARLALANLYWATGRKMETEATLRKAVEIEPESVLANRALVIFLLASNRAGDAERPLHVLAERASSNDERLALADYYVAARRLDEARAVLTALARQRPTARRANLKLAELALRHGDRTGARRHIGEVLAKEPRNVDALIAQAQLELIEGDTINAAATIRSAAESNPGVVRAQYALGRLLAANGNTVDAAAAYQRALQLDAHFAPANIELARLSADNSRYDDAIKFASAAVATIPADPEGHLLRARAWLAKGATKSADDTLTWLSTTYPRDPAVQTEIGHLLVSKGDLAAARAAFERAWVEDPTQLGALEGLTDLDIRQKRTAAARARIDDVVATQRQRAAAQLLAARAYLKLDDESSAEAALRRALATDATSIDGYNMLGTLYLKQRRLADATAEFQRLALLQPKSVSVQTALGVLYQLQNRWPDAKAQYEKVMQIDPRAAVAANNLALIYTDREDDPDSGLHWAQIAKAGLPNASEVDDTLGWVYYKRKLTAMAIATLQRSSAAQPTNPIYLFHLGLAFAQDGQPLLARKQLERALELSADFDGAAAARTLLASLKS